MIRLKSLMKENTAAALFVVLLPILVRAAISGIGWLISTSVKAYENRKGSVHLKWLDRLSKNDAFNQYIYHTIKNDDNLKKFADEKLKTGKIKDITKFRYEKKLVDKWLNSAPAKKELDNLCKELYPNETQADIKYFKGNIVKRASTELTGALNSGKVKDYINKYAKGHNLNQL